MPCPEGIPVRPFAAASAARGQVSFPGEAGRVAVGPLEEVCLGAAPHPRGIEEPTGGARMAVGQIALLAGSPIPVGFTPRSVRGGVSRGAEAGGAWDQGEFHSVQGTSHPGRTLQ